MSLISCVLPSLKRQISCCKSFSISTIRATGSGSCLGRLWPDTTSCSTRGTSFLCLKATSFSPTGSEAAGGTLAPLLVLCLGAMLYEGTASSLSFTQSPLESPKCKSAFFLARKPKDPGPNTYCFMDSAWFTAAKWAIYKPSGTQSRYPTTHIN